MKQRIATAALISVVLVVVGLGGVWMSLPSRPELVEAARHRLHEVSAEVPPGFDAPLSGPDEPDVLMPDPDLAPTAPASRYSEMTKSEIDEVASRCAELVAGTLGPAELREQVAAIPGWVDCGITAAEFECGASRGLTTTDDLACMIGALDRQAMGSGGVHASSVRTTQRVAVRLGEMEVAQDLYVVYGRRVATSNYRFRPTALDTAWADLVSSRAPHLQRDAVSVAHELGWLERGLFSAALGASACDFSDAGVACGPAATVR